jgi:glyoxylase-like metal-dependent hydrolase (beta-lactamase superfamily II)
MTSSGHTGAPMPRSVLTGDRPAERPHDVTQRVGEMRVTALTDAVGTFTAFRDAFPTTSASLEREMRKRYPELFLGADWVLPFRAFLVVHPNGTALVDCGVGPPPGDFLPERQGWLPAALAEAGTDPADVDLVVLTHVHVDHIGWTVDDRSRAVFANARYVLSRPEWEFVQRRHRERGVIVGPIHSLHALGCLDIVAFDADLLPGLSLIGTPGHTPGHISVLMRSQGRSACILGDVSVHPAQLADTHLGYAHEVEPRLAAATRSELLGRLADERALMCSPHLPGSGFGHLERSDKAFSWMDVTD